MAVAQLQQAQWRHMEEEAAASEAALAGRLAAARKASAADQLSARRHRLVALGLPF